MTGLPSLAHLATDTAPGGDPAAVWAEYRHIIDRAISGQERSQQTRIGPSELGTDCLRCLARKLAGIPEPRDDAPWLPYVGTSVHAQLEEVFAAFNHAADTIRFLVETTVSVGEVDGVDITGHADLFDLATGDVTDWKIVGATTLRTAKANGPTPTYRTQAHLYGRGFTRRGLHVERVRIAYLPRNAVSLDQAVIWAEPYDESVALAALTRADGIAKALRAAGPDAVIGQLPTAPGCYSCPRFDPTMPVPGHGKSQDAFADLIGAA